MSDETLKGKLFAIFEKHGEFLDIQRSCLELDLFEDPSEDDDKKEYLQFKRLFDILDEYQEQSYLLDPYLESMVIPVVECLRSHAKTTISNNQQGSPGRVQRLSTLLYSFIKCRGYKTIIRFFPHEIADLSIVLDFLLSPHGLIQDPVQWSLRYVLLIWLSLICMIPFDLAQFDEVERSDHTATAIESSAKALLSKAGLEREGAALLLSRLYNRIRPSAFVHSWNGAKAISPAKMVMSSRFVDIVLRYMTYLFSEIQTIGLLQVICDVLKSGSSEQIQQEIGLLSAIADSLEEREIFSNNTAVRKYRTKLLSRIAMRSLPGGSFERRRGRLLTGEENKDFSPVQQPDIEVPEGMEVTLERLFDALQDKDTIVRWSAAKGIARISERLPLFFSDQILETILGLFSIHSIAAANLYDLPAIAESTWHGACLACAEMSRRGLALYFDIRKGAHSIGANVRDAAAYVIWALARSQDPSSLAPHSQNLAQRLIAVALYDREVHIRRAASAAFQEHVGRNSLFAHGIDILGKADFYAVSIRRNAFLIAAPQVAQVFLLNHILDVTLRHWDPTMRELGSQSLGLICLQDIDILGPVAIEKSVRILESIDVSDLHGGLLALCEIALAYNQTCDHASREACMREIFRWLAHVPFDLLVGPRNAIVTAASCRLISITLTSAELLNEITSVPRWRELVDYGLKHRTPFVQEAAAAAMASIQQSLGTLFGAIDYSAHNNALPEAIQCILDVTGSSILPKFTIEARRNCYTAISSILSTVAADISRYFSTNIFHLLFATLLRGLDDYSTDQRGDVGSWIRIACIRSITTSIEVLFCNAPTIPEFGVFLPPTLFHSAISGILKQGVERLDNVRQEAGECFSRLLLLQLPKVPDAVNWELPGSPLLKTLFKGDDVVGWNEANWLFPRTVQLLAIPEYRDSVLSGLVFSLGSKTDSTHRLVGSSLVSYAKSLPVVTLGTGCSMKSMVDNLITRAKSSLSSNTIVIPVLQTFNVLLEGDALARLSDDHRDLTSLQELLNLVTKNVSRIKSIPRIQESMKIVVNLLRFNTLFEACVSQLSSFLGHHFPGVRSNSAEFIYVFLQGNDLGIDTELVEEVLLETEWSSPDNTLVTEAAARVVELFLDSK
ncbi:hypothetical protein H0H92_015373 [Tricholoma furcatifolium]|nr:hypothetical protein H0H92_015373 [Tricholoma furcatifolium]